MNSTQRPETTDELDVDKDWKKVVGVKEGLEQYYQIEQTTDLYSLNTGKVLAKIGINNKTDIKTKSPVSYIVIDRTMHLNEKGIQYLCNWLKKLIIVTSNKMHPAYKLKDMFNNLIVIYYKADIDFIDLFTILKHEHGVDSLTIQSGGTLNSIFIRSGLVDHLKIVVAPIIVGGKDTPTLIDGMSLLKEDELASLKALKLKKSKVLNDSYIMLEYDVIQETQIV
ncbi:MAG: deaminase [Firmicutes bacterium HGW-Firmicutes-1]|nr:MAG: deaminase [Firmicutes bacterium HGW-Firmicutes-1]